MKQGWLTLIATGAIDKSANSAEQVQYDIEDQLELLKATVDKINHCYSYSELHMDLMLFYKLKQKAHAEILEILDKVSCRKEEKKATEFIEKYIELATKTPEIWPENTKKLYEFVKNRDDSKKLLFPVNEIQMKIDNLKEFALSLSSTIEESQLINNLDPFEFLKDCKNVFKDLEEYIEDLIIENGENIIENIAGQCYEEACMVYMFEDTEKDLIDKVIDLDLAGIVDEAVEHLKKKPIVPPEPKPAPGLCGSGCETF
ncbi:hypothetical protein SteCoe_30789 [Stentor coeruleus]|uniref:Uncharacterized protein n=1 Tax=Stentor coeruleus TaxID=5963 RepID=A0A1R2B324_9CILI|nr:hypothetical protein SteCoe_30789 [Stentor coeruleus]